MQRYAITGEHPIAGTASGGGTEATAGIIAMIGSDTIRPNLYYVALGAETTSADIMLGFGVGLFVAPGTWGVGGQQELTDSGIASGVTPKQKATASPTYAGQVLKFGLHQRATFEWFEDPERGIVIPAALNNGAALYADFNSSGTTPTIAATFHYAE